MAPRNKEQHICIHHHIDDRTMGLLEQLICSQQTIRNEIREGVSLIMSKISDWAGSVGPKLDRIQTGLDAVQALVEELQNSPGTITPEDQALLDQIEAKVDAIATDADSVPAAPSA